MHIQKINCYYNEKQKQQNYRNHKVTFKNHPDFIRLQKQYQITASSYFRRGPYYGSANDNFQNIINVFQTIFDKNIKQPIKMLIVGIGDSQEPFSYLAVIKNIIKYQNLSSILDLNIVDLQSKPSNDKLLMDSFYEDINEPKFVPQSFVYDYSPRREYEFFPRCYRVNDEIFSFLKNTYNNPQKSKWETRIQDAVNDYNKTFDIISINNTLGYIPDKEKNETVKQMNNILNSKGIFITDPYFHHLKNANIEDDYSYIYDGIFQKK